jgi:hypothetical protein
MKRLLLSLSLLTSSGCAATAYAQVAVVASTVNATQQITGQTIVTAPLIHWGGTYATSTASGGWVSYNNDALNESDFVNNNSGANGGFAWYNTPASGVLGSPLLTLNSAGNLVATGGVQGATVSSSAGGVSAFNGDLFANSFGGFTTSGSYVGYNAAGLGETDFVTQNGGTLGQYNWYFPSSSGVLGAPSMTFVQSTGTLTVEFLHATTVTANTAGTHTGAVVGNSSTATALAATPSQCSGVPATGITASGNANCMSSTYKVQAMSITSGICTTASGTAGASCSFTSPAWPSAFSDSAYSVSCTAAPPSGSGSEPSLNVYVSGKTTNLFAVTIQQGQASSAGANTTSEIDCVGVHN